MKLRAVNQNKTSKTISGVSFEEDSLGIYFKGMGSEKLLTAEQELELAKEVAEGNKTAKDKMIRANLRLVVFMAKKYRNCGLSLSELVQEGNIGLMRAVEKFDYRKGFRFSAYAGWWIYQGFTKAIAEKTRTIRLPSHVITRINKMKKGSSQLQEFLGRNPEDEEIAEHLGWTSKQLRVVKGFSRDAVSFDTPIGDEEGAGSLIDFIEDEKVSDPADTAIRTFLKEDLYTALSTLPAREQRVLELRFGLNDGCPLSLKEVGKREGLSRERIRQIEGMGLRHLRQPHRSRKLKAYIL
ncbi:RNA polymerase sigma factor RpoD [Treponema primitia ZAS-2]|uniref:RNA polymerase sigma factor n=1 Tax=Treponema primitia (strain ATCC BAA-887 / DSM 12427 / ZAS-2) TaxID=545694 RepID=F5YLW8_TREPZ|nr:sigma-70 family RNA polymerase sigma factor [Treponema primitia]AEF86489.1 RNA polymerase sigma factor RpoD [Treponema primitia ZAS-2]